MTTLLSMDTTSVGTEERLSTLDATETAPFVEEYEDLSERTITVFISHAHHLRDATGESSSEWKIPSSWDEAQPTPQALRQVLRFIYRVRSASLHSFASELVEGGSIETARDLNRAVGAVADLRDWLDMSIAEVCMLVGLSESTVYHWVANPDTRPRYSTINRLMATWALAGIVQEELGHKRAQLWWHAGDSSRLGRVQRGGRQELYRLADEVAQLTGASELIDVVPDRAVTSEEAIEALQDMMVDEYES